MSSRNALSAIYYAKVEGTEGIDAGFSMGVDKAIPLIQPLDPNWDFAFKNARPRLVKGADINAQAPLRPKGMVGAWNKQAWFRGLASAITALNPIELDPWFQAAGYAATYSGSAGAEQVAYTLASTGLKTISELYNEDGIQYELTGVRGELGLSFDVGGPLVVDFSSQGRVFNSGLAASLPVSPQFNSTVPQIATDFTTFTVDSFTAGVIRSFKYNTGNKVEQRNGVKSAGGVAGHRLGERAASWSVVLEDPALSDKDYRQLAQDFTDMVIHWTLPGSLYQSFDFNATHAKLEKVTASNDNGNPLITLEGGVYDIPLGTPVTLTVK